MERDVCRRVSLLAKISGFYNVLPKLYILFMLLHDIGRLAVKEVGGGARRRNS